MCKSCLVAIKITVRNQWRTTSLYKNFTLIPRHMSPVCVRTTAYCISHLKPFPLVHLLNRIKCRIFMEINIMDTTGTISDYNLLLTFYHLQISIPSENIVTRSTEKNINTHVANMSNKCLRGIFPESFHYLTEETNKHTNNMNLLLTYIHSHCSFP